ncbi:UNVERIFIED_CONTAM: Amidase 1 [Sesamum calycinum]|uniref:Amidase 1 n=1 Tax=Sesamum calycinum TaxID=2727403 RepID=A0AAW2RRH6_9LAMI
MASSLSVSDYGAFMEKFTLQADPSSQKLPLSGLTFAVKDIFDVEGKVTGFGNPDWARTHSVATSTAPAVLSVLKAGAVCVGKTVMDEMAYSINGENMHYGTPTNPCAADRVPGGSSSGSAVAVGAMLTDFSLGTDTGGSVRVPASYCGILGFRPSHGVVSTSGVIPMAQSFDTVGKDSKNNDKSINDLLLIVSERYEFKNNHGEWVRSVNPHLGPGISERVWNALRTTDESIDVCRLLKSELRAALSDLLGDFGILAIPTVPGPPPKLQTEPTTLETFRAKAFSLLSVAGVSGFCQVSIPFGMHDDLPIAVSLVAKHGSDGFLLSFVETLYKVLKKQSEHS